MLEKEGKTIKSQTSSTKSKSSAEKSDRDSDFENEIELKSMTSKRSKVSRRSRKKSINTRNGARSMGGEN